jgi:hypothetical protein
MGVSPVLMELPPEPPGLDSLDHLFYESQLRHVSAKDDQRELRDKECVVCGLVQNQWDYYQLPCLHYAWGTPHNPLKKMELRGLWGSPPVLGV